MTENSQQRTFQQLSDLQRSVVEVFALLYEPSTHAKARQVWNLAIADESKGMSLLSREQFLPLVMALIDLEMLSQQWSKGVRCNPDLIEIVMRSAASTDRFERIAQAIARLYPISERFAGGPLDFLSEAEFIRELRIAIYRQDRREVDGLFADLRHANWHTTVTFSSVLQEILTNPFDVQWFNRLSKDFFELGLAIILEDSVKRCVPAAEAFEILEDAYKDHQLNVDLCLVYAEQLWLRGCLSEASGVLSGLSDTKSQTKSQQGKYEALRGAIAFLTGHTKDAIAHYTQSLKAVGKSKAAQAAWFNNPAAVLFFFALLKDDSAIAQTTAEKHISLLQKQSAHWLKGSMPLLLKVVQMQQGKLGKVSGASSQFKNYTLSDIGLPALLEIYSLYWLDVENFDQWASAELPQLCQRILQAGYNWTASETAELLSLYQPDSFFANITNQVLPEAK
ncbi:MAG: hypothetical protein ABG776_20505, partial [Cyanobacteria bacterium J06555_13]